MNARDGQRQGTGSAYGGEGPTRGTLTLYSHSATALLERSSHVRAPELSPASGRERAGERNSRADRARRSTTRKAQSRTGIGNSLRWLRRLAPLDGERQNGEFGTVARRRRAGRPFTFSSTTARHLRARVFRQYGLLDSTRIDVVWPTTPNSLILLGSQTSIKATWNHNTQPDIIGYNIYRSTSAGGPFTQVNLVPTDSSSAYEDPNLQPLTRYYYQVSAVDASGNESAPTAAVSGSTNPPNQTVFRSSRRKRRRRWRWRITAQPATS